MTFLAYLCAGCFPSRAAVKYKVTEGRLCCGHPHTMVSQHRGLVQERPSHLGLPSSVLQCTLDSFPTFRLFGVPPLGEGRVYYPVKISVEFQDMTSPPIGPHLTAIFLSRCLTLQASHCSAFGGTCVFTAWASSYCGCGQSGLSWVERAPCPQPAGCPCE